MANKSITMTRIRYILQLLSTGISQRQIALKTTIHRKVINNYHLKFLGENKPLSDLLALDDNALSSIVYPEAVIPVLDSRQAELDSLTPGFLGELGRVGVTRKLLWQEYKLLHPSGYGYTQFCAHMASDAKQKKATMHFTHRPGEYLQIDFAGKKLHYVDTCTGELIYCDVLVCTLPYSKYTYVEAMPTACQENLFGALDRCLEFMGGVPQNVLSDNMRQYVKRNNRYEYTFQTLAEQWSVYYGTNLDATRPRKPKDKPTVENHVYNIYNSIYGRVRNSEFHSLEELNSAIRPLLSEFNRAPFQKLDGGRESVFLSGEKHVLGSLPAVAFALKHTTSAKVQFNYHVVLGEDRHQYSVPYQHIGRQTTLVYDASTVEIFAGIERLCVHKRDMRKNGYTTNPDHMPPRHKYHTQSMGWDEAYFTDLAAGIGPNSAAVFKHVLGSRAFVEQSYKACMGLKRLSEKYPHERFENACKRSLRGVTFGYGVVKNILEKNLDQQVEQQLAFNFIPDHANIRGAESYNN